MKRYKIWGGLFLLLLAVAIGCQPVQIVEEAPAQATEEVAAPPAEAATVEPAMEATEAVAVESTVEVEADSGATLELVGPEGTKTLTLEEIQDLPAVEGWAGIKSSTGRITPPTRFKGVPLRALAEAVDRLNPDMGVRVVAKDGYAMTFSYDQITAGDFITYDPATGDEVTIEEPLQAVVAYEQDGQSISKESDGPFRIVVVTPENNQVVDGHWSVKWVEQIELKSLAEEWTLELIGALTEEIDRGTFESCTAPGCHQAAWTDDKAQEWTGVPLWLLLGYVDDEIKHDDNAFAADLAEQGYPVEVTAADGYAVSLDSARLAGNNQILVANQVNGIPLTDDDFPLRLVGEEVSKKERVSQIVQITLHLSEEMAAATAEPTAEPEATAEPTAEPTEETPAPEPPAGEATLTIAGAVAEEQLLSMEALQQLEVVEVSAEHPKKGMQSYEGIRLNALLEQAGIQTEATELVVTAADGYQVELGLADVRTCADCLVAFDDGNMLRLVMPGMESNVWVKDVVTLEAR